MHKTTRLALTLVALAAFASGCAKSIEGTWRGTCEVETSRGGSPGTPEQVPVVATATKGADGKYALSVQIGTSTTCQHSGASTTQRSGGSTELAFAAMPCVQVAGAPGGNGHFTLQRNSTPGARIAGGADIRGGITVTMSSLCQLAQ